jgi:dTDP-4-amino-4,6-dideoxygalactose transaminase
VYSAAGQFSIPFNRTSIVGNELKYIREAVDIGQLAGDQSFSGKCQHLLEKSIGVCRAFLTTSCTHSLEITALLLDITPGDEVIIPSFTFVSTANAFVLRGARPVFVDIRPDTLNLDESKLEALITQRTRAIVPVHYAGVGCAMDRIMRIAQHYRITVIEDNAHGLFGKYCGQYLGTFGSMAALSFHATKNITCGEGGALLLSDEALVERAAVIREKGTNRSQLLRGQVDKYTWVGLGSSYVLSEVLAAFLFGQLERWQYIQSQRRARWEYYREHLVDWAEEGQVKLPVIPTECEQAYHMFYLLLPSREARQSLMEHLRSMGILAVFHYMPLHLSPMGHMFGGKPGDCPIAEDVSSRLLRLPFYNNLTREQQEGVVEAIKRYSFGKSSVTIGRCGAAA